MVELLVGSVHQLKVNLNSIYVPNLTEDGDKCTYPSSTAPGYQRVTPMGALWSIGNLSLGGPSSLILCHVCGSLFKAIWRI